jgi:hypothetical protein
MTGQNEVDMLRSRAEHLESVLEEVRKRIEDLEAGIPESD